jgi:hypothetical protein
MNQIILFNTHDGWMARSIGPHASEIVGLFGTDTLPTAFTARAEGELVLQEIQRLNPGIDVRIQEVK